MRTVFQIKHGPTIDGGGSKNQVRSIKIKEQSGTVELTSPLYRVGQNNKNPNILIYKINKIPNNVPNNEVVNVFSSCKGISAIRNKKGAMKFEFDYKEILSLSQQKKEGQYVI